MAGAAILHEALERAIADAWDGHMATTHGAHCAGPYCEATADTPAYVSALRRMWRDSVTTGPGTDGAATYRDAIRDLAHELGVDLDG